VFLKLCFACFFYVEPLLPVFWRGRGSRLLLFSCRCFFRTFNAAFASGAFRLFFAATSFGRGVPLSNPFRLSGSLLANGASGKAVFLFICLRRRSLNLQTNPYDASGRLFLLNRGIYTSYPVKFTCI
jgi:hypothetical protein